MVMALPVSPPGHTEDGLEVDGQNFLLGCYELGRKNCDDEVDVVIVRTTGWFTWII